MANIYWVGGAGTWNTTSTTNWASSSGGTGGTGTVPTVNDNVFFDSGSGTPGSVTMTGNIMCADFNVSVSGWSFAAGTSPALYIGGSFTTASSTTWASTILMFFVGSETGLTITTNGSALPNAVGINALTGYYTLGSSLTSTSTTLSVNSGTFDTGNYSITISQLNSNPASITVINRTIYLGSSTITLSGQNPIQFTAGLLFNAGTSSITCTSSTVVTGFAGNGYTFYNVTFSGSMSSGVAVNITGANVFNNLTFSRSTAGINQVTFAANQTVNSTLTTSGGTGGTSRVLLYSSVAGTTITITAAVASLSDTDFIDITGAGAATWSGTRLGDGGGNSGITFPTGKTVYYVGTTSASWSASNWSTSSGGATSAANFPLPQDTATINNSSLNTSATLTLDYPFVLGGVTFASRSTAITFAIGTVAPTIVGSLTLSSSVATLTGTSAGITFGNRSGTSTITSAGVSFGTNAVTINAIGATVQLGDAFTMGNATFSVTGGTFNTSNFNMTMANLSSQGAGTRTISLGSSTITVTGIFTVGSTGMTFNAGTSTINLTYGGSTTWNFSSLTYYNAVVSSTTQNATIIWTGTPTFNNLTFSGMTVTGMYQTTLTAGMSITVNGTFSVNAGTTIGASRHTFITSVIGSTATITAAATSLTDVDFVDIVAAGTAAWTGTRIGNGGGNSGITFDTAKTVYIASNPAGNMTGMTVSGSSGGASDFTKWPLAQDTLIIDNSSMATSSTISMNVLYILGNLNFSARSNAMTFSFGTGVNPRFCGNWIGSSSVTVAGTTTVTWQARTGTQQITSAGVTWTTTMQFNAIGATVQLQDAMNTGTNGLTLTAGTLDTNGFSLTTVAISSNNSNTRTLTLGASTVTISGATPMDFTTSTNATLNFGTSTVNITNQTPALVTVLPTGLTFYNFNFTNTSGGATSVPGSSIWNNISITSPTSGNKRFNIGPSSFFTVNGTFTIGTSNAPANRILIGGTDSLNARTVTVATMATLSDVDFVGITAAGTSAPWSGTRLGNVGGNSNITFPAAKTVYWNLAAGGDWSSTAWALSSGGTTDPTYYPLAQDTAIISDTGLNSGATITISALFPTISGIDASSRTAAMTINPSATTSLYMSGDLKTSSAVTWSSSSQALLFISSNTVNISVANTIDMNIQVYSALAAGGVNLLSALTMGSTRTFTHTYGSINLNGYNLTCGIFVSSVASGTRSIAFAGAGIYITGNNATVFNTATDTGLTTTGTPNVYLTYSGTTGTRTISSNGTVFTYMFNFFITAGSDTIAYAATRCFGTDYTGFRGVFGTPLARIMSGNLIFSPNMVFPTFSTAALAISSTTGNTYTIKTNGVVPSFAITVSSFSVSNRGTVQLLDNLTLPQGSTFSFSGGVFDLNGYILTTGLFISNITTTRSILFGTSQINVTGLNTTVFTMTTATGFTYTGTPTVNITGNGLAGQARSITFGSAGFSEANVLDFYITAGADTINQGGTTTYFGTLNFTGFTGTYTMGTFGNVVYRNLVLGSGMSISAGSVNINFNGTVTTQQNITTNGVVIYTNVVFGGTTTYQLQDAMTLDSARTVTLTSGTLDMNSNNLTCGFFSSSNSNSRALAFGTGQINVTGTNTTVFNMNTVTGFTYTGTPTVKLTGAGTVGQTRTVLFQVGRSESNVLDLYVTAGSDTVTSGANANYWGTLDFTGFSGTYNLAYSAGVYRNLTFGSGMITTASSYQLFLYGTVAQQNITTNGITINFWVAFYGNGGRYQLQDNMTLGSAYPISLVFGTLDLNGKTLKSGTFASSATSVRSIAFNSGTISLSGSGTVWDSSTATNLITTGPGTISLTSSSAKTFAGGGGVFAATLDQAGTGDLTITGSNSFANMTASISATSSANIFFTAGTTTRFTSNFSVSGTATYPITISSPTAATHTLNIAYGVVNVNYLAISYSIADITVGKWYAGPNSTDNGNNTGWVFAAAPNMSRLDSSGNLFVNGVFDELTLSGAGIPPRFASNTIYANTFDEVTISPMSSGLARKLYSNGSLLISGVFDEVTGL